MAGDWYWGERADGCSYHGPHDTREAAIAEARGEGAKRIFVGQSHAVWVQVDAETVIDQWANGEAVDLLYEDALEYWCHKVPKEKLDALSQELTDCFRKHLESWGERTEWEVISDPEEVAAHESNEGKSG
jgi:hypothetical protein